MNDTQLQLALAKMLPDIVRSDYGTEGDDFHLEWLIEPRLMRVRDTEMLHVCWLIENNMHPAVYLNYVDRVLPETCGITPEGGGAFVYPQTASWQLRAKAICKVRGVKVE